MTVARGPVILLAAYVVAVGLITMWPVPVDSGSGELLRAILRVIPMLTYERIEFAANIALFVPFGLLLGLALRQRHLVVPIALITTVAIESLQGLLISKRTPTIMDIVANVTGACLGLMIAALVQWHRNRPDKTAELPERI